MPLLGGLVESAGCFGVLLIQTAAQYVHTSKKEL